VNLVVDASVIIKWVFPDAESEENAEEALAILQAIHRGEVNLLQPPHWLVEAAAVITRLQPDRAEQAIELLDAMELPVAFDISILKRASRIGRDLDHHLFDTLYHAVALERDCTLVTADDTYARKAHPLGKLLRLRDWSGEERASRET
jgi:predicted nucleic acid-binding protein